MRLSNITRICAVLVDRANYGRMHPVMRSIQSDPDLELLTICAGSMLLERFGSAENIVASDGFAVDGRVYLEVEGSVPVTMAKSIGIGIVEFSSEFQRLSPDLVLLIGDRYEALAATIAAAYMNLQIAHIQGGEVSGSIDESCRHAISKFAHLHFPSTDRSAQFLRQMGEREDCVFNVGCPSGDYIIPLAPDLPSDTFNELGVGAHVSPAEPYLLVIFHPVTTQYGSETAQVKALLQALQAIGMPTIWIWPNIDAGGDAISKVLRVYREHDDTGWLHLIKNMDPTTFQKALKGAACAVGNSSSFVRDSTFSGTPIVLVGNRQTGREHGNNLIHVPAETREIKDAVEAQLAHGRYAPETLYGDGQASNRIVELIKQFEPYQQKTLQYVVSDEHANS